MIEDKCEDCNFYMYEKETNAEICTINGECDRK